MNRKIKFRVFEPLNKKMHYLNFALYEHQKETNRWVLPVEHQCLNDKNYTIMNLDSVVIMQYVGLKDKNGKEIYEGDIVKFNNSFGGLTGIVRYYANCKPIIERDNKRSVDIAECNEEDLEVLGNNFEN